MQRDAGPARAVSLGALNSEEEDASEDSDSNGASEEEAPDWEQLEQSQQQDSGRHEQPLDFLIEALRHPKHRWKAGATAAASMAAAWT